LGKEKVLRWVEFMQKIGPFLFPLIIDVCFPLEPDHRNWSNDGRLTDELAFLSKETWN
jgi:hypothetical protein